MRLAIAYGAQTPTLLAVDAAAAAAECDQDLVHACRRACVFVAYRAHSRLHRRLAAVLVPLRVLLFRPDIVHVQEQGDDLTVLIVRLVRPVCRIVLTVHDPSPHSGDDTLYAARKAGNLDRLRRSAALFHVHGDACRAALIARIGPARPIVTTMLGALFCPPPGVTTPPAEPGRVLMFGRMEAYKGVEDALAAAAILAARQIPFQLVLAGCGPELERLSHRVAALPCVSLDARFVPAADARHAFLRATLVLLPYRDATQSAVLAAAFGSGRPVIATRVGGLVDAVRDGVDGRLVEPGRPEALADAMQAVLTDAALARRLTAGAEESRATRFAWPTIAATLLASFTAMTRRAP